jgi:hypothetical protein
MSSQKRQNPDGKHASLSKRTRSGSHPESPTSVFQGSKERSNSPSIGFGQKNIPEDLLNTLQSPLNGIPIHYFVNLKAAKLFDVVKVILVIIYLY